MVQFKSYEMGFSEFPFLSPLLTPPTTLLFSIFENFFTKDKRNFFQCRKAERAPQGHSGPTLPFPLFFGFFLSVHPLTYVLEPLISRNPSIRSFAKWPCGCRGDEVCYHHFPSPLSFLSPSSSFCLFLGKAVIHLSLFFWVGVLL